MSGLVHTILFTANISTMIFVFWMSEKMMAPMNFSFHCWRFFLDICNLMWAWHLKQVNINSKRLAFNWNFWNWNRMRNRYWMSMGIYQALIDCNHRIKIENDVHIWKINRINALFCALEKIDRDYHRWHTPQCTASESKK